MYRHKGPRLAMAIVLVLLVLPLSSLQPAAQAYPASSRSPGCWSVMPIPAISTLGGQLNSISATSPQDVWAVGYRAGQGSAVIMHYDGSTWQIMPSVVITEHYALSDVLALTPNDVWAVGSYVNGAQFPNYGQSRLILHWDGSAWSVSHKGGLGELNGLSATGPNDIWAVGETGRGKNGGDGVIYHWDGHDWSSALATAAYLNDVVALSPGKAWAVGDAILHWDGTRWSTSVPFVREMFGLLALDSNNVWAVGRYYNSESTFHWDGNLWSGVPIFPHNAYDDKAHLTSAAALSPDDIWAVGQLNGATLMLHWDGIRWSGVPDLVPSLGANLEDVIRVGDELWAVGSRTMSAPGLGEHTGPREPLLVRYTTTPCPGARPTSPLNPPVPLPGAGGVTFPQTGKTVTGTFLNYWLSRGGLAQQGYPISAVIGETSNTEGKVYTAQYFERALFEYHPENRGTPYEVLLAHLGTFRYNQKYPGGAPNQRPNNDPGTVTFPETGKRLGGAFLQYWREHSGLMQQGFPISDEFTEVSPLDGRPYTVQYFERAVFEWHPENAPPNDVLLSHLGRFRYQEKYEGRKPEVTTPRQIPASVAPGTLKGGGNYLVWDDLRESGPGTEVIYAYDAARNTQFPISERMTAPNGLPLATNGLYVLWSRRDIDQRYLDGYILDSGGKPRVDPPATNSSPDFRRSDIAYSGRTLYYTDNWENHTGLFMLDIRVQVERKLYDGLPMPGSLRASDAEGLALWVEERTVGSQAERILRAYRGDTNTTQTLNTGFGAYSGYAASYTPSGGHNVVYSFYSRIADQTTYLHNLRSGTRSVIARGAASGPTITGERAAWVRWPSGPGETGGWSIELYDTRNGSATTVMSAFPAMPHDLAVLENEKLAFTADTDLSVPGEELYLLDLEARR
jgi:hypothetical protein